MNESLRQYYLQTMGVTIWQSRDMPVANAVTQPAIEQSAWDQLREKVSRCTQCALHKSRKQTVFGVGHQQADLLIVGEAPGYYEDQQGEPFVGRAGKLLNEMLKSIGLDRQTVYIANVLKCRPPQNRDPVADEVACCTPFLEQQIQLLNPQLILALGRVSAHYLLKSTASMRDLRGSIFRFGEQNVPLLVSYHPAYLLRSPRAKRQSFNDLLKVKEMLDEACAASL